MNQRIKILIAVLFLGMGMLAGCAGLKAPSYYVPLVKSNLESVLKSVVKVETDCRLKPKETPKKKDEDIIINEKIFGLGIVIKEGLVLIPNHLISHSGYIPYPGPVPGYYISIPVKKISEKTYLVKNKNEKILLKKLYADPKKDIALFKAPPEIRLEKIKIGNSDKLKVGTFVYLIGNPGGRGLNIRPGIVSAIDSTKPEIFTISNSVYPGDSGGAVLALRKGRVELVGQVQGAAINMDGVGYAIRINAVLNELKKHGYEISPAETTEPEEKAQAGETWEMDEEIK